MQAKERPEHPAFGDPSMELSFAEVTAYAKQIGRALYPYVAIGEPVAFYMEKSVPAVCAMFGGVYLGGFYSFIDVRQPAERAMKSVGVLAPAVMITDEANAEKAGELSFTGKILRIEDLMQQAKAELTDPERLAEADRLVAERQKLVTDRLPLYVNFTSGSTGVPKGVAVCHRNVLDFTPVFSKTFGITESDILANQAPFDFDVSVKDIYTGLYTGAKVQIIPREYFSNPTMLMDYLADKEVTVCTWAVSAMCFVSIMGGFQYRLPDKIRLVMFSGEVMPNKQLKIWQSFLPAAKFVNLYGPTEITCNCTYYELTGEIELSDVIPIGKAFDNETVFLLDDADHLVREDQVGVEGEICVSGSCVALGYYKDSARTRQAFVQNPLQDRYDEIIYRTGDIGRYDANGNLVYVSRKDFQIKHMGHRIELGEIETSAMACDGVTRACCLYDADKKRLILFFTGDTDKKALSAQMKEMLPPFMVPNKIIGIDDMPLNKNGKIDRNKLKEM